MRKTLLFTIAMFCLPLASFGQIMINEVDYDQPGDPDTMEFIELYNAGPGDVDLTGYTINLVRDAGGPDIYTFFQLVPLTVPAGGYFVMCDNVNVPNCNMLTGQGGQNWIQNGPVNSIELVDPTDTRVDVVGYETGVAGYIETSPSVGDPFNGIDLGISRTPDGTDTDDNNADFQSKCISPGAANVAASSGCGALPVELGELKATIDNGDVLIAWSTLSEQEVSYFDIELQDDLGFATIGNVEAENQPSSYSYRVTDLGPGQHTFRLRIVDADGSHEYSPEIEVSIELAGSFVVSKAYPNPFIDRATFTVMSQRDQDVIVRLYDVLGRQIDVLFQGAIQANAPKEISADGAALTNGTYFVRISGETFEATQTLVLQK